jgi:hypothetical protein
MQSIGTGGDGMNPEHKLLKFVIVPMILVLFGAFVFWHFNSGTQWHNAGKYYYLDNYQGDRSLNVVNVQDFLDKTWDNEDLRYVVSMWHDDKNYFFNKQARNDQQEINSNSIFRMASISKVFTSIAMLQLVEKGKVSLDDPVEKYVSYKKNFVKQPTVGQLLLHTAGFDNNNTSFFYNRREEKPTLKDFLFRQELVQVIEPGIVVDYTNTSFDIAGYIIEQVSGQSFEVYCNENIFQPLGMVNTTFDEPESYIPGRDNNDETVENYFVGGRPSGGLVSTSADMSRFLECLMHNGKLGKKQVFSQKLMEMIFEKKLEFDPKLPLKKTPVFWIDKLDEKLCFGHMGKIIGFSAHILIIPGKVALFCVAADENTGQHIGWSLLNTFFSDKQNNDDLSVVFSKNNPEDLKGVKEAIDAFAGRWINMFAWNRLNAAKLANAVAYNLDLRVRDGKLLINDVEMERVDDLTFRSEDWYVKFVRGENGQLKYLQTGQDAHIKAPWYMDSVLIIPYLILSFGVFFLNVIQFLFGSLMRMWGREKSDLNVRLFRLSLFLMSLSNIVFGAIILIVIAIIDIYWLGFKPGFLVYALFALPMISALLLPLSIFLFVRSWKTGQMSLGSRINGLFVIFVQTVFVLFMYYWNLLGFKL